MSRFLLSSQLRAEIRRPVSHLGSRSLFTRRQPLSPAARFRSGLVTVTGLVLGGFFILYASDSRAGVHRWVLLPALQVATASDPEKSHRWGIQFLKSGLSPRDTSEDDDALSFELWDRKFSNPIGLAAGFDKHAEAIDGLFDLGFGYVEVGSVTPEPQYGNAKPRVFRVPESEAVINRYGFNSVGHDSVIAELKNRIRKFIHKNAHLIPDSFFSSSDSSDSTASSSSSQVIEPVDRLANLLASDQASAAKIPDNLDMPRSLKSGRVLGINLGKNKSSDPDSVQDFVTGVQRLGPYADVLVVNISSPNTSGLRGLQRKGMLAGLLDEVLQARNKLDGNRNPPVLIKVAPDLSAQELQDIGHAALDSGINGIIVSNTTISRPASAGTSPVLLESGGLSGKPLKPLALKALSTLYKATEGKIPLIGAGGISSGQDAIEFAKAGATFIQLYTALSYQGLGLPRKLKDEIVEYLHTNTENKKHWIDLVGSGLSDADMELAVEENNQRRITEKWNASLEEIKNDLETIVNDLAMLEAEEKHNSAAAADGQARTSTKEEASSAVVVSNSASSPSSSPNTPPKTETVIALKEALVKEERGKTSNIGPLGNLFSSFGQRSSAGSSSTRVV